MLEIRAMLACQGAPLEFMRLCAAYVYGPISLRPARGCENVRCQKKRSSCGHGRTTSHRRVRAGLMNLPMENRLSLPHGLPFCSVAPDSPRSFLSTPETHCLATADM